MARASRLLTLHPSLEKPDTVLVVRSKVPPSPTWEVFRSAAAQALATAGVSVRDANVVIKPNFTSGEHGGSPESGIQTHAGFVWGMLDYLREHGGRRGGMYVFEDGRDMDDDVPRHWRGTGMPEVAEKTGVKLRCTTRHSCTIRKVPQPMVHATRRIGRLVVAPRTVLINVPKLKTHNLTVTTLCLKNLMGVVNTWDRHYCGQAFKELPPELGTDQKRTWKGHEFLHRRLAMRLADLSKVVHPALNVVEGVIGRDGSGFGHGRNYRTGLVIIGTNVVAVDTVASYLMGFDPARIIYLQVAAEAGLGPCRLDRIRVLEAVEGKIVSSPDVERLRAARPFRLFAGVKGYGTYVWGENGRAKR